MPGPIRQEEEAAVLLKLKQLTTEGKLTWASDERLLRTRENVIGHVYTADFAGGRFAIHEFQYAHYFDEDQWSWVPSVRLELIDSEGRLLYEINVDQQIGNARALLDAVRRQTAGVDRLMRKLLGNNDDDE